VDGNKPSGKRPGENNVSIEENVLSKGNASNLESVSIFKNVPAGKDIGSEGSDLIDASDA